MAKRRTREEMREEYLELLEIWPYVRAFDVRQGEDAGLDDAEALLPTESELLDRFDNGPGTPSAHLKALKSEFQQMAAGFAAGLKLGEQTARDSLTFYRNASGRDFFSDVDDQSRRVIAILKRGQLLDDADFRLIKMCFDDDLNLIPTKLIPRANAMLSEFENNAQP